MKKISFILLVSKTLEIFILNLHLVVIYTSCKFIVMCYSGPRRSLYKHSILKIKISFSINFLFITIHGKCKVNSVKKRLCCFCSRKLLNINASIFTFFCS